MYLKVFCPSKLLYSSIRLDSDPQSFLVPLIVPSLGRSISTPLRQHPYFTTDPIDLMAFITLVLPCNNILEVFACRHIKVAVVCLARR
jgi:hypothetical protein